MNVRALKKELVTDLESELAATTFGPIEDYKPAGQKLVGWKSDAGKVRMELLPPEFLTGTAQVLTFGAQKYGVRNWEKGLDWSRAFGALERHMWAWWGGEQSDAETGMSHLWHASCCLAFLVAYEERGTGKDDRPNTVNTGAIELLGE